MSLKAALQIYANKLKVRGQRVILSVQAALFGLSSLRTLDTILERRSVIEDELVFGIFPL